MIGAAAYEFSPPPFDAESAFEFSLLWQMADGTDFPWSDYTIEYQLSRHGCPVLALTQGNGITADQVQAIVTFAATNPGPGEYEHICRVRDTSSGNAIPVFDGPLTILRSA